VNKIFKIAPWLVLAALVVAVPGAVFAGEKTHEMTAEIVSIDAKAKTITIKAEDGNHTAPLLGAAIAESKNFKAGDKVTLTCLDDDKGTHEGVKAIKKAS